MYGTVQSETLSLWVFSGLQPFSNNGRQINLAVTLEEGKRRERRVSLMRALKRNSCSSSKTPGEFVYFTSVIP